MSSVVTVTFANIQDGSDKYNYIDNQQMKSQITSRQYPSNNS